MPVSLKTPLVIANDRDLVRVSHENPGYRFEREVDGALLVSPTNTRGCAKSAETFVARGSRYAVAVDPSTRQVVECGKAPEDLLLDFDAIIDA